MTLQFNIFIEAENYNRMITKKNLCYQRALICIIICVFHQTTCLLCLIYRFLAVLNNCSVKEINIEIYMEHERKSEKLKSFTLKYSSSDYLAHLCESMLVVMFKKMLHKMKSSAFLTQPIFLNYRVGSFQFLFFIKIPHHNLFWQNMEINTAINLFTVN